MSEESVGKAPWGLTDRRLLLLFFAALAMVLGWRALDLTSFAQLSAALLQDRSGLGAGELLIAVALIATTADLGRDDLSKADLATVALASLFFATPWRLAACAPVLAVGVKLALRKSPALRSTGHLLLALAVYEWLGPALFHLVSPLSLKAEALGVQALLGPLGGFSRSGVVITGPTGHAIYIEEGCSAFHNLSFAAVLWISLLKLETPATTRWDWATLAAMSVVTIVLNLLRIALMAQSYAMFVYWHDGSGATVVSVVMLAAAVGVYFAGRELTGWRWRRNASCGLSQPS